MPFETRIIFEDEGIDYINLQKEIELEYGGIDHDFCLTKQFLTQEAKSPTIFML